MLEGGSIESDGDRTLFTTTGCLIAPHRNQPLTQEEIDKRLRLFFPNVERVVWLDYGQLTGDDTDGHIDTIVRVAPNHTLLYIGCDDKEDEHYEDFRLLEEQLKQLRTIDGDPYRLLRLPMPDAIYDDGERYRRHMPTSLSSTGSACANLQPTRKGQSSFGYNPRGFPRP